MPFQTESIAVDASKSALLELKPEQFAVEVAVESSSNDFQILLSLNDAGEEKLEPVPATNDKNNKSYKIKFFAKLVTL